MLHLGGTILTRVQLRYTVLSYLPHAALAGAREENHAKLMVCHNRRLLYYTRCLYILTFPRSASSAAGTLQVGEDATRSIVVLFTITQYCTVVSQIDKRCPILPHTDENRFITNIRIYRYRPTLPSIVQYCLRLPDTAQILPNPAQYHPSPTVGILGQRWAVPSIRTFCFLK